MPLIMKFYYYTLKIINFIPISSKNNSINYLNQFIIKIFPMFNSTLFYAFLIEKRFKWYFEKRKRFLSNCYFKASILKHSNYFHMMQ